MSEQIKPGTPLPWGLERTSKDNWIGPLRKDSHKIDQIVIRTDRDGLRDEAVLRNDADADYIVEACNNYPTLQARIERLEKALKSHVAAMDTAVEASNYVLWKQFHEAQHHARNIIKEAKAALEEVTASAAR